MNDGVCLLDKEQKILRCNAAMTKLCGKPYSEIIGRLCSEVVHGTIGPTDDCPFNRMMENRSRQEVLLRRGDRYLQEAVDPVIDSAGHVTGAVQVFSDITELKRAEESLRKAHDELERRVEERTAEVQHLSSQLLAVQEDERKKLSRELHDSIGQSLAAIKLGAENALSRIGKGATEASVEALESLIPTVQHASEEIRKIHTDLRPSMLDDLGIVSTIFWFCREFEQLYSGICIVKTIEIEEKQVPEPLKIVIFRALQEALNNAGKYSEADLVRVSLRRADGKIELLVADNGQGFDVQNVLSVKSLRGGFGLTSIKERTQLSGGAFAIESTRGAGTVVRASWPI